MSTKTYFLTRKKTFVECEVVKNHKKHRRIKVLEGEKKNKVISVHPEGVAWGNMYPRVFQSSSKPTDAYIFKGRVLLKNATSKPEQSLVPELDEFFRFQPFTRDVIDGINSNEPVLLTGGTGVGKTTCIEQLANRSNKPTLRINFNGETRLSDLIGKMQVINGETKWVDGVLPTAMRKGYWMILDELDSADPAVLTLLHPVLESNPVLVLKENNGEVIKPVPGFRLFATANSIGSMEDKADQYAGTNKMNGAFLDRWLIITCPNMPLKEELRVVKDKVGGLKHRWALKIVEFANKVRERQTEGMEVFGDSFSTRRVLSWSKKTALHRSPLEGARIAWLNKMPASEHENIGRLLQLHFGNTRAKKSTGAEVMMGGKTKKK